MFFILFFLKCLPLITILILVLFHLLCCHDGGRYILKVLVLVALAPLEVVMQLVPLKMLTAMVLFKMLASPVPFAPGIRGTGGTLDTCGAGAA